MLLGVDGNVYVTLLATVGLIALLAVLLDTLWNLLQTAKSVLEPYFNPQETKSLAKKYGGWALITGCTDGIGKAYAKELARRKINIVLVSRTEEKLRSTAQELENEYGIKTKTISADFTKGPFAIAKIKEELGSLPIGILVNNVGQQYSYPMSVGEVPEQVLWNIINVNVGAVTMMTKLLVEEMKSRGNGAIVCVSSGAECQPLPLFNVYAATKVYVSYFTEALRHEYSRFGITVQHLSPLFINTKMNQFSNKLQQTSLFVPDADTYAKYAVNMLGRADHSTGYWAHGIQYFFINLAPMWLRIFIGAQLNKSFRNDYFQQESLKETM